MKSAVGIFFLSVGMAAAITGIACFARGLNRPGQRARFYSLGRKSIWVMLVSALGAVLAMEWALLSNDFSIRYVAENNARATPLLFTITGLWAALEGSILLWALILCGYIVFIVWRFRERAGDAIVNWALIISLGVAVFFFVLMLGPANPFVRTETIPLDGQGPNPLLQNHPLMAFHPPMLYLGYVGFVVPFAFASAALITGRFGEGWLADVRRTTLIAWGFLSLGVVLGGWWSYEVLGWGGFWAWDPVENASLLPWLTGTAFIHSVMSQERRGMLRVWNLSLILATFALTILGTFLTRSGVLNSVHAFSKSDIGPWLLSFLGVIVLGSVALIAWRGDAIRAPTSIDSPMSREAAFLANNLVLAAFAFVVLLGTVFPLVVEAINDRSLSVGEPYFNRMTIPLGLALLFLMAVAPLLGWRATTRATLSTRALWPAVVTVAALVVALVIGARGTIALAFALAGFSLGTITQQFAVGWWSRRQTQSEAMVTSTWRLLRSNPRLYGGLVVHLGVTAIALAVTASAAFTTQRNVKLSENESATVAGYTVRYEGIEQESSAQKDSVKALVRLSQGDRTIGTYAPALSTFPNGLQGVGTPSVRTGIWRDIYLTLVSVPGDGGEVTLSVAIRPMIVWLWIGGGLMGLGTVIALLPRQRREVKVSAEKPARELVNA